MAVVALRLCCALLLLQLLLLSCAAVSIYDPEYAGEDVDGPRRLEDADDEGAGVITVHAPKRKPPPGSRVSPPPAPPVPPASGNPDCPPARRKKRSPKSSKPLPVREKVRAKRSAASNYHCPESWKELDFSEVHELECPENATGWFPFPPDCRKYLNCWNGRGFLQACAPATLFHPIRRECDYPEKVKCLPSCRSDPEDGEDYGDIVGDPVDYVDPAHPRRVSPLIDARSAAGPLRRVAPDAAEATPTPTTESSAHGRARRYAHNARLAGVSGVALCQMEGGTGLQAHPTDCNKFFNCWKGKPHSMTCAGGTVFSTRINACDHPRGVPECVDGKRVAPGVEPPPAQPGDALPLSYTQPGTGGGYNQFGNQGYQPPPRQTFLTPGYADQVPAASSGGSYGPNQVLPPPGRGKSLHPELQPVRPGQQPARWSQPDPNLDVEGIGSGGVIGPLPRPHNEQWHRQHGVPMPGEAYPGHTPASHDYHHHHHHQQGHHYNPPPTGPGHQHGYHHHTHGLTPQPGGGHSSTQPGNHGGYNRPSGSYTPQPGDQGGYNRPSGSYTPWPVSGSPQGGHHPHPGHNADWHHRHGVPMPGGHRGTDHSAAATPVYEPPTTTPSTPTTTCATEWEEEDNGDGAFTEYDIDLRTGGSSNWITVLERTKNTSMPQSGQMVRIRGGPTPLEGYVEVMGPGSKWGSVCDSPANWTVEEASVVCRMLGYERGAELAWQGRPRSSPGVLAVHVEQVHCSGREGSFASCSMSSGDAGDGCNLETQAAALRCYPNYVARCRPGEVPFKGSCYSVTVPRRDRKIDDIAFSQDEAIKHCKSQGGHLLDIGSQAENDFISEWLTAAHPEIGSVLTSGVGVSVPGGDLWVWEDTRAQFQYNVFWPGPPKQQVDPATAPKVGARPLCILLKKDFPCETWPGAGPGARWGSGGFGNWQGARTCAAEYFFWHAEDCAIRQKAYPYVCERKADDVGCLTPGTEYEGAANVSWNGQPCVSWDWPAAASALRYRVPEDVRRRSLTGHNQCRSVGGGAGAQEPWCFVLAGSQGIKAERCDVPQCKENKGNSTGGEGATAAPPPWWSAGTTPSPGLYEANGRPRPPASAGDDPALPPLSRPYPPVYLPRPRDDPLADPRGTGGATGGGTERPWPTLPTSRPFIRPNSAAAATTTTVRPTTAAWPDPFAGRAATPSPRAYQPRPGGGRTPPARLKPTTASQPDTTSPRPDREEQPGDAEWPVNYAPGFSHREVGPTPAPAPPTPSRELQPPYGWSAQPERTTTASPVYPVYPVYPAYPGNNREREEYAPPEARADEEEYANVPDPLQMPTTVRPATGDVLGYGARPDPSRGYGLPVAAPLRPPVVTARPPAELYNYVLPGQSYAPYTWDQPPARPSYSNLFGLLPALSPVALSYYPSEGRTAPLGEYPVEEEDGSPVTSPTLQDPYGLFASSRERPRPTAPGAQYPYPTAVYPSRPGNSDPYSQVGYYPSQSTPSRPKKRGGSGEGDSGEDSGSDEDGDDDESSRRISGRGSAAYNGHAGPGGAPSRQSRTAGDPAAATASPAPTMTPAPTTVPPFSRPNVERESEHVMKIPKPGEKAEGLQVTTEKLFFM